MDYRYNDDTLSAFLCVCVCERQVWIKSGYLGSRCDHIHPPVWFSSIPEREEPAGGAV